MFTEMTLGDRHFFDSLWRVAKDMMDGNERFFVDARWTISKPLNPEEIAQRAGLPQQP